MSEEGYFIVVEGPEGAGKSTLVAALATRMRQLGMAPVMVREPGGTAAGELARQALLDPDRPIGPVAELFFYLAARAELVEKVIGPALRTGGTVLSDRFSLSTEAYQIAGRGLDRTLIQTANEAAVNGLRPHLTIVVDLDPAVGLARHRAAGKRLDRLDRESADFHRRVAAYYLAVRGDGVQHLDGTLSADQLLHTAWDVLCGARPEMFSTQKR